MCRILGSFAARADRPDPAELAAVSARQRHGGPDEHQVTLQAGLRPRVRLYESGRILAPGDGTDKQQIAGRELIALQHRLRGVRSLLGKARVNAQIDHPHALVRHAKLPDDVLPGGLTHRNDGISSGGSSPVELASFLAKCC